MVGGIHIKVCGITRAADAAAAAAAGADFLGFILHPASPRHVSVEAFRALRASLPSGPKRVAVLVEPTLTAAGAAIAAGADVVQAHFPVERWEAFAPWLVEKLGPAHVWLAPKAKSVAEFPEDLLAVGKHYLIDAYRPGSYGGTGQTGDWPGFASLRARLKGRCLVLAGGLSPENIGAALAATDARWVDVNSGVESAPGVKDHARLQAFFAAVAAARGNTGR